ncbi:MAG TPA: LppX_LprAFG lipoprotein [Mycobacterium sp.]|nr:LppX_LprAFG lipoprotein [Mycobacterium sp.]
MTPMRKLLIVLTAASTAAALLVGCSAKQAAGPLPDAATLVKDASAATKDVKSAHLQLSVAGKIKNLPVKTLQGDLTNQPSTAAKGNATITLLGSDVDVKFVVIDGDLYAALSGDDYDDYGPAEKIYDVSAILDPDKGLANLLANFLEPKANGRETIDGQQTVKVTGQATADAVNKLAPQLKATAPMPATVWIQETGDHQLVQAQLEQSPGNTISMTLSNWNAPVTVDKPAGA